jgi:Fic family protein
MGPDNKQQSAQPELEQKTRVAERSNSDSTAFERHFTVAELAILWSLSEDTIRRCFQEEPGVIEIVRRKKVSKRRYTTLRIPASVVERVHRNKSLVR